ncbi:hypothetical protein CFOL_v3_08232, partial [Cephalotus follicularis]
QSAPSLCSQ